MGAGGVAKNFTSQSRRPLCFSNTAVINLGAHILFPVIIRVQRTNLAFRIKCSFTLELFIDN